MARPILVIVILVFLPTFAFARGFFKDMGDNILKGVSDNITEGVTGRPVERGQQQQEQQQDPQQQQEQQEQQNTYQPNERKVKPRKARYQSGTIVRACGCNGNVEIGIARQNNSCASGVSETVLCRGGCNGGGSPWAVVCQ